MAGAPRSARLARRFGHHVGAVRLLSALAVAVALALVLPHAASAADPPGPVMLAQGWQFAHDAGDAGLTDNWQSGQRGLGWEPVTIPHVPESSPDKELFYGSIGWYRLNFTGPQTQPGVGWAVRFEQVRRIARVWLNGREIGIHHDPYTPFELRAPGLRPGQPNTLVVRVDYRRSEELREGWWNWGGITRQVSLVARGGVVMHDAGLLPQRVCVKETCAVERARRRLAAEPQRRSCRSRPSPSGCRRPTGRSPRAARRRARCAPASACACASRSRSRAMPKLWSPESPDLYAATVATRSRGADGAGRSAQRRPAHRRRQQRDAASQRSRARPARRLDPGGHPGPRTGDDRRRRRQHDRRAQGARRQRHARALPARPAPAGPLRQGGHPRLEPGAGVPPRRDAQDPRPALARARRRARHDPRGAQPPVGHHALRGQRADVAARRPRRTSRVWMQNAAVLARDLDPTLPVSIDILSYPNIAAPDDLRRLRHARDQLVLRLVQGQARAVDGATSTTSQPYLRAMRDKYPRQGARDDGVRRRGDRAGPRQRQADLRLPDAVPQAQPRHRRPAGLHGRGDLLDGPRVRGQARLGRRRAPVPSATRFTARGSSPTTARSSRRSTPPRRRSRRRRCTATTRPRWPAPSCRAAARCSCARCCSSACSGRSPRCSRSTPGACATSGAPGARRTARARSSSCPRAAWRSSWSPPRTWTRGGRRAAGTLWSVGSDSDGDRRAETFSVGTSPCHTSLIF